MCGKAAYFPEPEIVHFLRVHGFPSVEQSKFARDDVVGEIRTILFTIATPLLLSAISENGG